MLKNLSVKWLLVIGIILPVITSCTSINKKLAKKVETKEYYRIFDIKTDADRYVIAKAAMEGLAMNTGNVNEELPIPSFSEPPEKPGRFKIENIFKGSRISTMMAAQGSSSSLKVALCPDAVWIAHANKTVNDYWSLKLTSCLFQYKEGYHLDLYGIFTKHTGGIDIAKCLGKAMADTAVGTPEQWTEKVFLDIVRNIYKTTNANITFLEGYPPVSGTPWLDSGENIYEEGNKVNQDEH